MEILRRIFTTIWKTWFFICFSVPFLILFPFFYVSFISGRIDIAFILKKFWARTICVLSGIIPVIRYQTKKYTFPKTCIIVSNHSSYLDIVMSVLPVKFTCLSMAKAELLKIPLFKLFFKYMDIPVNRKSKMDAHKAFVTAGEKIDKGFSILIYPEGTISNEGVLKPFKNGAFKLAIDKQLPIVPMVFLNNWKLLQNGGFFKSFGRPGVAPMVVGDIIETKGLTEENLVTLKEKVRSFIEGELIKVQSH